MTVSISLHGILKLDQTAGIQNVPEEDEVNLDVTVNQDPALDVLTGSLDSDFLAFLNALSGTQLTDAQKAFAALVEGASDANFVTVTATQGETIGNLVFSDASGAALNGDQVFISAGQPLQTVTGQNIYLWSALGGQVVLATTSSVDATSGSVVAAFYIESNNAANTSAKVESVTFIPIAQPDTTNPDDTIDFSDVLKVSTTASLSFNFNELKSGSSLWVAVGTSDAAVLVSGKSLDVDAAGKIVSNTSNTIHTSQGGDGTTIGVNNQLFDNAGETAVFTLVSGFTNLGSTTKGLAGDSVVDPNTNDKKPEGIDYGGYLNVTGAGVFISQSQGNDLKSFDINVFRAGGGTTPEEGFGYIGTEPSGAFNDDTPINVKTVTVLGVGGTPLATWSLTPGPGEHASGDIVLGVKVEISANNIDVDGLLNGFTVNWTTDDQFNRFQLVQEGGAFDVGRVNITQGQPVSTTIGDFLQVDDDGPTAPTVAALTSVTHDETAGVQLVADPNPQNDIAGDDLPDAVLDLFNAIGAARGDDPGVATKDNGAIGFAMGAGSLVSLTGGGFGTDGAASSGSVTYALSVTNGTPSGLSTTEGTQIFLYNGTGTLAGLILGRVGTEAGATDTANPSGTVALALTVDASGTGYVAQYLSLNHAPGGSNSAAYDNQISINSSAVKITVTNTDGDHDAATSAPVNVGDLFKFQDDGPTITDAPVALSLTNTDPVSGTQTFGYDIGSDNRTLAEYQAGASDFVDTNPNLSGTQINLSGFVDPTTGSNSDITNAVVTRTSETGDVANFSVAFDYDGNPLVAGTQTVHATGTLSIDKAGNDYTLTLDDPIVSFSTTIFHTSEVTDLNREPDGNSGQPNVVVERLAVDDATTPANENFYVQFTADTIGTGNPPTQLSFSPDGDTQPPTNDHTFDGAAHDLVGPGVETWASATQTTNGVAGDIIGQGENLTLRFFSSDILSDGTNQVEKTDPTGTADGIAIKFDNIGNAEDLIVIVDLIDPNAPAGQQEITRSIVVENSDFFKTDASVPSPYNTEFDLDNNDGLLIIEANDYNLAGEHYQLQGVQIMQSANGLTGSGINLNRATGVNGGSPVGGTLQSWTDPSFGNENDNLKITDIGFIQTQTGTQDASLDFSFQIVDGDGDTTATQHLLVDVLNA